VVTIVGEPSVALATAQAFAAVPGVTLRLRTRATFHRSDAQQSSLVVLDHWIPKSGLPPSPAVLLVDPPRLPGGRVAGALAETVVSGTDAGSELLGGVELSALSIEAHAASRLEPPRWLAPVVWSPAGVLLAAGDNGRQRVAVMSFEPGQSNLPQLPALPILAANLVQWASGWAPTSASAGAPFSVDASSGVRALTLERAGKSIERLHVAQAPVALSLHTPGLYTLRETGPGIKRDALLAVNTAEATTEATGAANETIDLRAAMSSASAAPPVNQADWFLAAALAILCLEWAYWVTRRRRVGL
jgi:hypothetical protein